MTMAATPAGGEHPPVSDPDGNGRQLDSSFGWRLHRPEAGCGVPVRRVAHRVRYDGKRFREIEKLDGPS